MINMKGGVGKTTLAMQLAMAAASKGIKVLAVDSTRNRICPKPRSARRAT
ncbi:MAG: AAA family ATPase [Limisphaerales bacterium]